MNEEVHVEGIDLIRLLVDIDEKIDNDELEWFSNMTAWRVGDCIDRVRWDGTARIDRYYKDFAAKIMSNERKQPRMTVRSIEVLLRIKEDWCMAVFMPPTNNIDRMEWKVRYLSYLMKNDHEMDVAEARCLAVYLRTKSGLQH